MAKQEKDNEKPKSKKTKKTFWFVFIPLVIVTLSILQYLGLLANNSVLSAAGILSSLSIFATIWIFQQQEIAKKEEKEEKKNQEEIAISIMITNECKINISVLQRFKKAQNIFHIDKAFACSLENVTDSYYFIFILDETKECIGSQLIHSYKSELLENNYFNSAKLNHEIFNDFQNLLIINRNLFEHAKSLQVLPISDSLDSPGLKYITEDVYEFNFKQMRKFINEQYENHIIYERYLNKVLNKYEQKIPKGYELIEI
ncbi:hypothetical protein [Xenorhabdus bovienii]|uniref:hypothetical protein n=1 Tax=Xenorhabdus bovienii TaxID=40576 RepID=UPI0023B2E829|nr:hypothetical protein [Xenorhabdus bovienii]MDE9455736.1 hypothetical protein [Xenorhabdus bovienii]